ncbi:chloride channel protein [Nitratiruptor tergarcus]|uniref:H+/Cl-antiporter ClcA n=1 Tax=Nitratiruptor tergarcus DSM 16512 TaxID=1069081 RepID=A0A1W1WQG9_9BACT|nr:chloride channel protein [Nitratiruptor tergarcus]SMC08554.1 H+/Cl-antiporter ClcA [Nitratiruptor tergarcus DSM 16512]
MIKKHLTEQTAILLSVTKWMILSTIVGIIIGSIVTLFLKIIQFAEHHQSSLPFPYYYTLPFVLMLVVWMIRTFAPSAEGHGTEKVIEAVHKKHGKIDLKVVPIKLIATVLTIFAGGSVGKEGPAGQIGAASASGLSDLLRFNDVDRKKIVICGISAGFASVFGTPIAGAIFGVEVLIIGVILYDVLLPSFIAGFAAFTTAQFLGIEYTYFDMHYYQSIALDIPLILKVVGAGLFFGLVSDIVVTSMNFMHKTIKKIPLNIYLKTFIIGSLLVLIGLLFGTQYLGLGMDTIKDTLNPDPYFAKDLPWYAFLLKAFTTSLTLSGGGSGGVITPIFYIGATSGHAFGAWFDYQHITLFAALGFVSVLSGATNAPIAATIMAVELFGLEIAHYAALSAVISFLVTGHRSVFPSQILAMKKSEILEVKIGEEIEKAEVELENRRYQKIRRRILRKKLRMKK